MTPLRMLRYGVTLAYKDKSLEKYTHREIVLKKGKTIIGRFPLTNPGLNEALRILREED